MCLWAGQQLPDLGDGLGVVLIEDRVDARVACALPQRRCYQSPILGTALRASSNAGTELLCRGLAATGVAGRPREYFLAEDPARLPDWRFWEEGPFAAGHDVSGRESYLSLVYRLGTTPNGVFGAKIHRNTLRWALAKFSEMPRFAGLDRGAILRTAFPGLRVVDVTRRDRARQAVSGARMAQDGMWVDPVGQPEPAWPPPTGPPRYDYRLIAALEALIAESEPGWRQACWPISDSRITRARSRRARPAASPTT